MNWEVPNNDKNFRLTEKIGIKTNWNQNDAIINIVKQRQQTDKISEKIGSHLNSSLIKQRQILLKIGHDSYVNT